MDIAVPHLVSGGLVTSSGYRGRLDVKADAERGLCGEAAHCQAGEHEEAPVRQGGVKSERLSCRRRSLGRLGRLTSWAVKMPRIKNFDLIIAVRLASPRRKPANPQLLAVLAGASRAWSPVTRRADGSLLTGVEMLAALPTTG